MEYIVHQRFKGTTICGNVNLPYGTTCQANGNVISHNGNAICAVKSQNAHQHFARNDDGNGLQRGELTKQIQTILAKRDPNHQNRWDKIWADPIAQKYQKFPDEDYWLWSHEFFNAEIFDLEHILKITKEV